MSEPTLNEFTIHLHVLSRNNYQEAIVVHNNYYEVPCKPKKKTDQKCCTKSKLDTLAGNWSNANFIPILVNVLYCITVDKITSQVLLVITCSNLFQ